MCVAGEGLHAWVGIGAWRDECGRAFFCDFYWWYKLLFWFSTVPVSCRLHVVRRGKQCRRQKEYWFFRTHSTRKRSMITRGVCFGEHWLQGPQTAGTTATAVANTPMQHRELAVFENERDGRVFRLYWDGPPRDLCLLRVGWQHQHAAGVKCLYLFRPRSERENRRRFNVPLLGIVFFFWWWRDHRSLASS